MKNVIQFPAQLRIARSMALDGLRYRTIHGYRRAFIQAGSGPAVLLIHGIGDSADSWLDIIPTLARDHTVIAPDLLGHGDSDKPRADYSIAADANAMRDLLSVLDIDRVTVIWHSLNHRLPRLRQPPPSQPPPSQVDPTPSQVEPRETEPWRPLGPTIRAIGGPLDPDNATSAHQAASRELAVHEPIGGPRRNGGN